MGVLNKVLSVGVAAASVNNICLSQSLAAPGSLLLNGSTAGTLTYASQVKFTFGADETGHTFVITGTSADGQVMHESIAGNNTSQVTVNNYLTVTSITGPTTTGALTVGTNAVGNSATFIADKFINPAIISVDAVVTGTISFSIQISGKDLSPAWDVANGSVTWQSPSAGLTTQSSSLFGTIQGPITMLRVAQLSGTGSVVVIVNTPMGCIA